MDPDIDLHRLQENISSLFGLQGKNKLEHFLSMTFAIDTGVSQYTRRRNISTVSKL